MEKFNRAKKKRGISFDDNDLDKIDNALEVYKFVQEYSYKKEIHLMY